MKRIEPKIRPNSIQRGQAKQVPLVQKLGHNLRRIKALSEEIKDRDCKDFTRLQEEETLTF